MTRLSISLEINPERDTIQDAITSITEALSLYGRQNGGVLGPWLESRAEARGLLSHHSKVAGTWRVVEGESAPIDAAREALADIPAEIPASREALERWAAQVIAVDRRIATRITSDPDF